MRAAASRSRKSFYARFNGLIERHKGRVLKQDDVSGRFAGAALEDPSVSNWLNAIEQEYELVCYLGDETLTDWTRKAIRQADQVLIVASGAAPEPLNPVETFAFATHPPSRRRLVRLHERRSGSVTATAAWLAQREVGFHHHVSIEDDRDFRSLHRFLTGRATGYVAAGGGGFGPAHIGVFKAFAERGVTFDILGGTSVGAALLGGFSLLMSPEELDRRTHDVFVVSRAFKRVTYPRYALLDHVPFDAALRRQFGDVAIEDAWRAYFAVATVLDGSGEGLHLMRRGPMWKAVRASSSLPAVLPPVLTDDGRMLVDGAVIDNIPLRSMKALKAGPNLVVHFGERGTPQRFAADDASIPGRWSLMRQMLTPSGRRNLSKMPSPIGVIQRCLVMHQAPELLPLGPLDLVLAVPVLAGANFMDFDRHTQVFEVAYQWCRQQIDQLLDQGNPALAALLATRIEPRCHTAFSESRLTGTAMNLVDAIGATGAVLTTVCWLPQAVQIVRERDTRAISLTATSEFSAGMFLWLVYGMALADWPLIGSSAITLALMLVILALKLRHG